VPSGLYRPGRVRVCERHCTREVQEGAHTRRGRGRRTPAA
jgi:hypothetical protein